MPSPHSTKQWPLPLVNKVRHKFGLTSLTSLTKKRCLSVLNCPDYRIEVKDKLDSSAQNWYSPKVRRLFPILTPLH